ncbi:MAG: hypothetical protein HRU43_07220, partial [Simkaniaceae bacterium]|nr:hypothetical protein [Simkaniaceae bacterium]
MNLPRNAAIGETYSVNSRDTTDSLGINHDVISTYRKTETPLQWARTVTAVDAPMGGILQASGANIGKPYNDVIIQFDANGRLLNYNGVPAEIAPPTVSIDWQTAGKSFLSPDFGTVGASDAIRLMDDQALTVQNDHNGRSFSIVEGIFIGPEGGVYSICRNCDKY